MTEDEAKTKWCPFARVGSFVSGLGSINRGAHADGIVRKGTLPTEAMCIASSCAVWRETVADGQEEQVNAEDVERWKSAGWAVKEAGSSRSLMVSPAQGFCGLAGRPAA